MKNLLRIVAILFCASSFLRAQAQTRYWVHKPFYENFFGTAPELSDWNLVEDDGAGSFGLSGTGTAVLTMDDAAGSYANRIFSVSGGSQRLLPLDSIAGRLEINILRTTGGNQRFFVQAQTFTVSNSYINQITILPATTGKGFFTINMRGLPWPSNADKIRIIIGGENYSGQQGTIEFDYLSYSNTSGVWNNTANWSASSGGTGGSSVPTSGSIVVFDGGNGSNGSCQFDVNASVAGVSIGSGYSGNIDLQAAVLTIGNGGITMAGGGVTGNQSTLTINGDVNITGGTFKSSAGLTSISGNVLVTAGSLNMNAGTIQLNGSAAQSFSSASSTYIHRFVLDNPAGLTLGSALPVLDSLELVNGTVTTGSNAVLLGASSANAGLLVAGSGKINGGLQKWFSSGSTGSFTVPFGSAGFDAPLTVQLTTAPTVSGTVLFRYQDLGGATTSVAFSDGPATILSRGLSSWSAVGGNGLTGGVYTVSVSTTSLGYSGALSDLHLTLANGVVGTHAAAAGTVANPVLTRLGLSLTNLANSFYVGAVGAVLPLQWLRLQLKPLQKLPLIEWTVAEQNVKGYTVQRSRNGAAYADVKPVPSKGNGTNSYEFWDEGYQSGRCYYRIQSNDDNGALHYSPVVSYATPQLLTMQVESSVVTTSVRVKLSALYPGATLLVRDEAGRTVCTKTAMQLNTELPMATASKGIYFLTLTAGGQTQTLKLLKQ